MTRYLKLAMSCHVVVDESHSNRLCTHTEISLCRVIACDANGRDAFLGEASNINGAEEVQRSADDLYAVLYGQQWDPEFECLA
jgi:hypothetical protein